MTNLELEEALRKLTEQSDVSVAAKLISEHLDQLEDELLRRLILASCPELGDGDHPLPAAKPR
jgi:hypothetical protein